jgi:CRP/FNR family cyclic AMP-dependent transcriptional regulator
MARDEKLDLLSNVGLFSTLNRKELTLVGKSADQVTVGAETTLVAEGSSGHEFYLILEGTAVVRRNGRKVAALGPGDYFGELALLDGGPRSATVTAETDLEVLIIGQRQFFGVLEEIPPVALKLLATMAHRLRQADVRAPSH